MVLFLHCNHWYAGGYWSKSTYYYNMGTSQGIELVLVWDIHVSITFSQHHGRRTKKQFSLSKAEKKLMLIFCSFIVFGVYTTAFVSLITKHGNRSRFGNGLTEYFACEASGHVPGRCSREVFEKYSYPYVAMVSYLLLGSVPITHLNYVLDWQSVWNGVKKSSVYLYNCLKQPCNAGCCPN